MYTFLLEPMASGLLTKRTPWEEFIDNGGIAVIVLLSMIFLMFCLVVYFFVRDDINERKMRNRQVCNSNEIVGLKKCCSIHLVFCYDGIEKIIEHNIGEVYIAEVIQRDGYSFEGWYSDSAKTTPYTETTVHSDLTLFAKWVKEAE